MTYRNFAQLVLFLGLSLFASAAHADRLVEEYNAYIGEDDLYNSAGDRLSKPWQVIRQDRANVHRFGISQDGDESDRFFASAGNRDRAERMIQSGTIEPAAGRAIMRGDIMINVKIFRGSAGDYIDVTVE